MERKEDERERNEGKKRRKEGERGVEACIQNAPSSTGNTEEATVDNRKVVQSNNKRNAVHCEYITNTLHASVSPYSLTHRLVTLTALWLLHESRKNASPTINV